MKKHHAVEITFEISPDFEKYDFGELLNMDF
jgi:hypothetical protein